MGSRFGKDFIDAFNVIALGLPGTPITYYGEEIGMVNGNILQKDMKDSSGRDPYRTPMQWDDSAQSGKRLLNSSYSHQKLNSAFCIVLNIQFTPQGFQKAHHGYQ